MAQRSPTDSTSPTPTLDPTSPDSVARVDHPIPLTRAIALVSQWRGWTHDEAETALVLAIYDGDIAINALMLDGRRRTVTPLELCDIACEVSRDPSELYVFYPEDRTDIDYPGSWLPAFKRPVIERANLERVFKQPAPPPSETEAPAIAGADSAALSRVAAVKPASTPRRTPPGKRPTGGWSTYAAREVIRILRAGEETPSAAIMCTRCDEACGYHPDVSEMQRLIKFLLS
jgi:hypothetical protein